MDALLILGTNRQRKARPGLSCANVLHKCEVMIHFMRPARIQPVGVEKYCQPFARIAALKSYAAGCPGRIREDCRFIKRLEIDRAGVFCRTQFAYGGGNSTGALAIHRNDFADVRIPFQKPRPPRLDCPIDAGPGERAAQGRSRRKRVNDVAERTKPDQQKTRISHRCAAAGAQGDREWNAAWDRRR